MNIYIGNLNYRVRENELQQRLEEYGAVDSVKVIKDRETGRSKGYAFAEMPNAVEAQRAISEMNETEFEGRQMVVKEALPRAWGITSLWTNERIVHDRALQRQQDGARHHAHTPASLPITTAGFEL